MSEGSVKTTRSAFVLAACLLLCGITRGEQTRHLRQIEGDLLKGNWQAVMKECDACDPNELRASPVLCAVKGHACLALNRNNESLMCFAFIGLSPKDSQAWLAWACEFADVHRDNAIALYFKGDALARGQKWAQARASFDEALRLDKSSFLALNARGVVKHALGDTRGARSDFKLAAEINKGFADSHASRGTLNIYEGAVPGAKDAFERARELSGPSWVVINGLGCAACGEQLYDEADKYFAGISKDSPLWPVARRNAYATAVGRLARTLKKAKDAGMSITDLILNNSDGKSPILFSRDPDDKPIYRIPDGRGGWYEVDSEGRIIRHIPAPGTGGEEGGREGDGQKEGNEKMAGIAPPLIDIDPEGVVGIPRPPNFAPPFVPPLDIAALAQRIQSQLPQSVVGPVGAAQPGGADTGSVQGIRANRGLWLTHSVYGLLYRLPPTGNQAARPATMPPGKIAP